MSKQSDLISVSQGASGDPLYVDTTNDRVGIGTSSPSAKLQANGGSSSNNNDANTIVATGTNHVRLKVHTPTAGGFQASLVLSSNETLTSTGNEVSISTAGSDEMRFATAGSERMRIDGSGVIRLGNLNEQLGGGTNYLSCSGNGYAALRVRRGSDAGNGVLFYGPNSSASAVGSIDIGTSSVSYVTSSDYRLKENVIALDGAADRLAQIPVHRFNFITDPDTTVDGFLAHEVQAFVPEAITGEKDDVDADGNPEYQGIDQSKLVPLLTAALQEALQKIDDMETRLAALEAM